MTDSTPDPRVPKRSYKKPRIRVFGSLAALTRAVGAMGNLDGGTMIFMRRTGTF